MKRFFLILAAALCLAPAAVNAQDCKDGKSCSKAVCEKPADGKKKAKNTDEVIFKVNLHCQSCVEKITQNVGFEKGVKDIDLNLEKGIVKIEYNPKKTSPEKLQAAFVKLGYDAVILPSSKKDCCGKCGDGHKKECADKCVDAPKKDCCGKCGDGHKKECADKCVDGPKKDCCDKQ